MTFAHLDKPVVDKSNYSYSCFTYRHNRCKGSDGKCNCPCHDKVR